MEKIVFLNFGGIGDEILFSPVIRAVRELYPDAHLTLILESRSGRVRELLPELNSTIELDLRRYGRAGLFWKLLRILRQKHFDVVISSGSSPFISLLLGMSGIKTRVGYDSGPLSRLFLSGAAPLDKSVYAGDMYFSLAKTFIQLVSSPDTALTVQPIPRLSVPAEAQTKMSGMLAALEPRERPQPRIMIHPGVSRMSVEKNILKSWPVTSWQALILELIERYPQGRVYLLGGPDDQAVLAELEAWRETLSASQQEQITDLYGKTASLKELGALLKQADVLISVDSAPVHLAVGLAVPLVAIFAPTDEHKLVPDMERVTSAARTDLACRPCLWDVRKTSCANPVCLEVPVDLVVERVEQVLGNISYTAALPAAQPDEAYPATTTPQTLL